MHCVVIFLDWKATWWYQQQDIWIYVEDDLADGLAAYAAKQAHINHSLTLPFAAKWYPLLVTMICQWSGQKYTTQSLYLFLWMIVIIIVEHVFNLILFFYCVHDLNKQSDTNNIQIITINQQASPVHSKTNPVASAVDSKTSPVASAADNKTKPIASAI